jgi:hypothetical protein
MTTRDIPTAPLDAILPSMTRPRSNDNLRSQGEAPDEVWVTVTRIPGDRGPSLRERVASIQPPITTRMLIGLLVVAAATVALAAAMALGGRGGTARSEHPQPPETVVARVLEGYPLYPLRCSEPAVRHRSVRWPANCVIKNRRARMLGNDARWRLRRDVLG